MKTRTKILIIVSFALALCFVLVGCGGKAKTDFVWYKAAIPDSYQADTHFGDNCAKVQFRNSEDGSAIDVSNSRYDVNTLVNNYSDMSGFEDLGEKKMGQNTWRVCTYDVSGNRKDTLYFMVHNDDGPTHIVHTYYLDPDGEAGKSFVESLEFADGGWDIFNQAKETPIPEIK